MRPVERAASPIQGNYDNYHDAFPDLASRLGFYCCYCERQTATFLHVEHLQPKDLPQYAHLAGQWNNFLLACVNCNSTKGYRNVLFDRLYFPDRDNTFAVFVYTLDGCVTPATHLTPAQQQIAQETLELIGLDKPVSSITDANGIFVSIDRGRQRMDTFLIAQRSQRRLAAHPTNAMREQIVETALAQGLFSIWMEVFKGDTDMRQRLIEAFPGTARDCFDANTLPVSPRPSNGLAHAGKI